MNDIIVGSKVTWPDVNWLIVHGEVLEQRNNQSLVKWADGSGPTWHSTAALRLVPAPALNGSAGGELLQPLEQERRVITIDIDTGELLNHHVRLTSKEGARIAASVLPGIPAEEIERAYMAWGSPDPRLKQLDEAIAHMQQYRATVVDSLRFPGIEIRDESEDVVETWSAFTARKQRERDRPSANDPSVMHIAAVGGTLCGQRHVSHRTDGRRYAECPVCIDVYDNTPEDRS